MTFVLKETMQRLHNFNSSISHMTNITQPNIKTFTQHYLSLSLPTQIIIPQHAVTSKNESGIVRSSLANNQGCVWN